MTEAEANLLLELLRRNWRSADADAVRSAYQRLHRTERQNVLRNIAETLLQSAAMDHQDGNVDLRNEAGSRWAYEALEIPRVFPYI